MKKIFIFIILFISSINFGLLADDSPGKPLDNTVEVGINGCYITLEYKLLDTLGKAHENSGLFERGQKPTFEIYKGNLKLGTGKFEYG